MHSFSWGWKEETQDEELCISNGSPDSYEVLGLKRLTASRLWLISAPSSRFCLLLLLVWLSVARSLPARSMKDNLIPWERERKQCSETHGASHLKHNCMHSHHSINIHVAFYVLTGEVRGEVIERATTSALSLSVCRMLWPSSPWARLTYLQHAQRIPIQW